MSSQFIGAQQRSTQILDMQTT